MILDKFRKRLVDEMCNFPEVPNTALQIYALSAGVPPASSDASEITEKALDAPSPADDSRAGGRRQSAE